MNSVICSRRLLPHSLTCKPVSGMNLEPFKCGDLAGYWEARFSNKSFAVHILTYVKAVSLFVIRIVLIFCIHLTSWARDVPLWSVRSGQDGGPSLSISPGRGPSTNPAMWMWLFPCPNTGKWAQRDSDLGPKPGSIQLQSTGSHTSSYKCQVF